MKKNTLLFLLSLLAFSGKAQIGISIQGSEGFLKMKFPSFDKFADGYNTYSASAIDKKLQPFGNANVKEAGLAFRVQALEVCISKMKMTASTSVTFTDKSQRIFDLKRNLTGIEFGFSTLKIKRLAYFGAVFGFALGTSTIDSYYIYPDGTKSYGSDKYWNGSYTSFNGNPYIGLKTGIGYKWIRLLVKGDYMWRGFFGADSFQDWNIPRSNNVYQQLPDVLPLDINNYVTNRYSYQGEVVKDFISGFRFQVGISIDIMSKDDIKLL
jgi:hypothetical protein